MISEELHNLREALLDLMSSLIDGISILHGLADELVQAAKTLDGEPVAQAMHNMAQRHREKIQEMQRQFVALADDYARRFHQSDH